MTPILVIVGILTVLGVIVLATITIFFYWGDVGRKRPLTREERRALAAEGKNRDER